MTGSVTIATNPLPTSFTVTGGGGYCVGGIGLPVGLSGSATGTTYQLFNGATLVGAASGTGGAISFGLQAAAGTNYNVVGTTSFGCTAGMSGSVSIVINSLPLPFTVTGGGNFCAGGTGVAIGLSGSTSGVNYQLYNGSTPVGTSATAGTGSALNFGLQSAAGTYTVVAYNPSTTCSGNMPGSAVVGINPAPVVYAVTGGGNFCAGSTSSIHVGLALSDAGISYQLLRGGTPTGLTLIGTGSALDFGIMTIGGTYTVVGSNPGTSCSSTMGGSATVVVNPLPSATPNVTGGGNYCSGSAGMPVGLSGSATGINYQLYIGTTAVGSTVAGTGSAISFGLQTLTGTYNALGINPVTGCSNNMTGTATIGVNPLPGLFVTTGGGNFCAGGTGVHIGLSSSTPGISYQLMNGSSSVGIAVGGTGGSLDFGLQTAAGTYTVLASNPITTCTRVMTGTAIVNVTPAPAPFTITGGGDYCSGGSGKHVGLSSSATGINYQLYLGGASVGVPLAGTGLPLDFGLHTAAGSYQVVATDPSTTCNAVMPGTATIVVDPLPVLHTITGGGNYCSGTTGVNVGLDNSNTGTSYQLYNGAVAVGSAIAGLTGAPINFGLQTAAGTYTVVATNTATGCTANMLGSVTVGVYPLPVVYNVTGGGNYCTGGTGVRIGLSGSNTGILYQLYNGSTPMGGFVAGTGSPLDFGMFGSTGTYTIVASNSLTSCTNNMNGTAIVGVSSLPVSHLVTGGGNYCTGSTGVHVGLNGSNTGSTYQLFNGTTPVGTPFTGTGLPLDFGLQTAAGTYTVVGMNTVTCTNTMTGSATVGIDPLPTVYLVAGGGNYCAGGTGVDVSLSGSDAGTNYQLYNGTTMVGSSIPGTGFPLDFGMQTAAGTYMVVATNGTTSCSNNMTGSVAIAINPSPVAYTVGGGGNYCAGGAGVHVTLSGSSLGISYQLYNSGIPMGTAMTGTGAMLDFGLQTIPGSYSVVAANTATTCANSMTGSVVVSVKPLPNVYPVGSITTNYCAGSGGVDITLAGSDAGVNYQLYNGTTTMGAPVAGTGSSIDFGYWLPAGPYTVMATNTTTGCTNNMAGGITISVNPLPTVYNVTGGGTYCNGGSGVHIGLSNSNAGITYQLLNGGVAVGAPVSGTGSSIDFGLQAAAGNYTVVAANSSTTCTGNMSGSATVVVSATPTSFAVTGGGNYCVGGTGVNVGLSGSASGINYHLYKAGVAVGGTVAGTGSAIDFGPQTAAGSYSVLATSASSGCTNNMSGTVSVGVNPAPVAYTVTGGGNFCPGGSGVHVGLNSSASGISYQLFSGGTATGGSQPGSGSSIDFGLQTTAGVYTVVATNSTTGCTNNMSSHATVVVNTLPTAYNVTGGGNYCSGAAGVHIGLTNTSTGVNYTLYSSSATIRTLPGTGGPLDFGLQTGASTYTVIGSNATTGCSNNMTGSATITVTPIVTPFVSISTGVGDTVCEGSFVNFTITTANTGTSPTYQWNVNGAPAGVGSTYGYAPANGDVISVTLTSSATCATPSSVTNAVNMTVDPMQAPAVSVTSTPGSVVCQGTSVTFSAVPSYGGTAPTYTWMKNSTTISTAPGFSYVPANGDVVYCILGSNYHCRLADNATSSHINMQVDLPVVPAVSISSYPGLNIAAGQAVTFTATVTGGGGPTPSYQWLINGAAIAGATQSTFVSSNLFNGDSVTCHVLSSGGCSGMLGSSFVVIHVIGTGVGQINTAGADIRLLPNPNKGTFAIKGTLGTTSNEEMSLEITDMLGQVIYSSKVQVHNGEVDEHIALSKNLANGMYILNLHSGADSKVFHFVLEQ
jgi:hypothetical protein